MKRTFDEFEDKDKVVAWSSKNLILPHEVSIGNREKFKFDCYKCGHEFESALYGVHFV